VPVDSVKSRYELYVTKCARCHKLKDPALHTLAQLQGLVTKIQKRAKVIVEEKTILLTYLSAETKK